MAQWNPYFGVPNQNDYEEQNISTQNYFGVPPQQYGNVPVRSMSYNNYYVPNNIYSNFATNIPGTVYNVHELEAQQFASFAQNPNSSTGVEEKKTNATNGKYENKKDATMNSSRKISKLTATAAEFKPSTSNNTQINSQTFYNNKDDASSNTSNATSKGAIRKNITKPVTDFSNNSPSAPINNDTTNKFVNRKIYNNKSNPNYNNEKYKSNDKRFNKNDTINDEFSQRQNNYRSDNSYSRNFRKTENIPRENNELKYNQRQNTDNYKNYDSRNSSRRYEGRNDVPEKLNRQTNYSHSKSDTRFNKYDNKESNFNRNNHRDYSDRNLYSRDRFSTNTNNSYRNSRYDKTYENWRSGPSVSQEKEKDDKYEIAKSKSFDEDKKIEKLFKKRIIALDDDISQRERLTDQVNKGNLECLVCCERVRQSNKIWHCQKCFHIFHFRCITKWGTTSKDDNGWRCPACQHVCAEIPSTSYCYCGKVSDPQFLPGDTAHSCGEVCGRAGVKPDCVHRCNLLCHPGPCPKCEAQISKKCNCGATSQIIVCSAETILVCSSICNKKLQCGVHTCDKICHAGDCNECLEKIHQECYCGKNNRDIPCSIEQNNVKEYSCEEKCDQLLKCGNHNCKEICHPGDCAPCAKSPEQINTCPCGKSKLEVERTSCLDPIPCCGKMCGKRYLLCGTHSQPHVCKSDCHEGDCPPCALSSFVRCRCGHMSCEIFCAKLNSRTDDARCEKKCTKKRACGRHKCNQLCCIDIDHICPLPCNHSLSCGLHKCEKTCHKGRCQPCWRTSFDELYCECGASVIYPPVACGTKRPHCNRPCTRQHECDHDTLHTCHSQPECPPCTVLTTKWCFGGHEQRKTIPCNQKEFSCGLPCGKDLACGRHKCQLACHKGPCLKDGQNCIQACTVIRESCEHTCGLPCHQLPCPESPCKELVKVTCECGLRSSTRTCVDMASEYQRIATSMLNKKIAEMQLGHSMDITCIIGNTSKKPTLKTLECNDECRLIERNRRLAIGLQIRNPDLSAKLTPRYSEFMRQWSKKDQSFCQLVHDKLTELVQLAKQSKQKSRSYSFPSMNRDKRHFIHEYCEHFGCESAAYDQEPNRNVVATAAKDKAWLPSCSLLELIQRESGQRKVPGPILNRPLGVSKNADIVSLKIPTSKSSTSIATQSTSFASTVQPKSPEVEVDYFNFPPTK